MFVVSFVPPVTVIMISSKTVVDAVCNAVVASTEFSDGCFFG